MKKFIIYWLPPLIWMAFIFYFSTRQNVSVNDSFAANFIILKTLHAAGYAILNLLLFRAIYSSRKKKNNHIEPMLMKAALIALLYSASDEIHQQFVPTRTGKLRDVIIDSGGIAVMYIYIQYNFNRIKQFLL